MRSYIKRSKECFIRYQDTEKLVKKTRLRLVFSTHFSVSVWISDETLFLGDRSFFYEVGRAGGICNLSLDGEGGGGQHEGVLFPLLVLKGEGGCSGVPEIDGGCSSNAVQPG